MSLQFQQDDSLRAQRMTADEAKAVIDLWQQERVEQTGLTDKPAVPDLAEGLDLSVEDVQRLLREVRTRRVEEERALAQEQELSEIRLAEEERKLAEIRRQRAELRREQAEFAREGTHGRKYVKPYSPRVVVEPLPWEEYKRRLEVEAEARTAGCPLEQVVDPAQDPLERAERLMKMEERQRNEEYTSSDTFGRHIINLGFVIFWSAIAILCLVLLSSFR